MPQEINQVRMPQETNQVRMPQEINQVRMLQETNQVRMLQETNQDLMLQEINQVRMPQETNQVRMLQETNQVQMLQETPGNAPGNQPGSNAPGNQPGSNAPGNQPGSNAPGNQPGIVDLVILIDSGDNTKPQDFEQIKEIIKAMYRFFAIAKGGTHVAFAVFSVKTRIIFNLFTYFTVDEMDSAVDSSPYPGGESYTGNAFTEVKSKIFDPYGRPDIPHVLVIVVTGRSTDGVEVPAQKLRESCVLMFAMGIGTVFSPVDINKISNSPRSEYVMISETFPEEVSIGEMMASKIFKVFDIGNDLLCSPKTPCVEPTAPPILPPTLPYTVDCGLHAELRVPIYIVFLIDASDAINDQDFRSLIEITKITYSQFPIFVDGVHVAVVIYGAVTKIVFNLDQLHDVSSMNKALGHVVRVGGVSKVGLALQTIKDSVFEAKSRQGVPKRLIHMMCGKTIDDVVGAAKRLHDVGVLVIAAGTCIAVSKPELCIIGSPPTCENALIMKTMNPVSAPGCEFAAKILKAIFFLKAPTAQKVPSVVGPSVVGIHVPVPVPVPIPVPVDPYTHQPIPGHISHGVYYPAVALHSFHNNGRPGNNMIPFGKMDRFDPYQSYEHPLDSLPKDTDRTPIVHESFKDIYNSLPPIDPLRPDPGYLHPVSHHILHNGKIFPHPGHRVSSPMQMDGVRPLAQPPSSHTFNYGYGAYDRIAPQQNMVKNNFGHPISEYGEYF
ncbi:hypothetical protein QZH41_003017 [Actinostola sp. cb2023]|nr:hypothetical protein QZH41_003017 [Actinostola sp. cb2023]